MAGKKCANCGEPIAATPARKRTRGITLGRGPTAGQSWQRTEYDIAMRVKRGELVWSYDVNADRFGARGGYVTPEEAERRAHERGEDYPRERHWTKYVPQTATPGNGSTFVGSFARSFL